MAALKRFFFILLVCVMLVANIFSPTIAQAAESKGIGYITLANSKGVCAIRAEPSRNSKELFSLADKTGVSVLGTVTNSEGSWYHVRWTKDYPDGYVPTSNITFKNGSVTQSTESQVPDNKKGTQASFGYIRTSASSYPVRTEPSKKATSSFNLTDGTGVNIDYQVVKDGVTWYWVRYLNFKGYVDENHIRVTQWKEATGGQDNSSQNSIPQETVSTVKYDVPQPAVVQVESALNGRNAPTTKGSTVVMTFSNNTFLQIIERTSDNKWFRVIAPDGQKVWCSAAYIQEGHWEKMSTGQTNNPYTRSESKYNAALACSRLTGMILLPGETFSWLRTMGACSERKGFKESTVLVNGEPTLGYGGGVCQVSTTMNICVKNAGISTVAKEHSVPSSYAARADEATVSYGSNIDFKFSNPFDTPIMMLLTYNDNGGVCSCTLYRFVAE